MPVLFFVSSVAAGVGLVILVEAWIAKAWGRTLRPAQLASLGTITFWALLAYEVLGVGDLLVRGELANALAGPHAALFAIEIAAGGLLPLAMLSSGKVRAAPNLVAATVFLFGLGTRHMPVLPKEDGAH